MLTIQKTLCYLALASCSLAQGCGVATPVDEWDLVVWSRDRAVVEPASTAPLIEHDRLFVADEDRIMCFALATGDSIWSSPRLIEGNRFDDASAMVSDEERIYVHHRSSVFAVDKNSGDLLWETKNPQLLAPGPSTSLELYKGWLFHVGNGVWVRLQAKTGEIDLIVPVNQSQPPGVTQILGSPVVSPDGMVYFPAAYFVKSFGEIQGNVHAYSAESGDHLWTFVPENRVAIPRGGSNPVMYGAGAQELALIGAHLLVTATGILYKLDRLTGQPVWEQFPRDGILPRLIPEEDLGLAYAGSTTASMYAFDLETGEIRWKAHSGASTDANVVVEDDRVYFASDHGGMLYVWDALNGDVIWKGFPPGHASDSYDTFISPIAVGGDYMANLGATRLYVMRKPP